MEHTSTSTGWDLVSNLAPYVDKVELGTMQFRDKIDLLVSNSFGSFEEMSDVPAPSSSSWSPTRGKLIFEPQGSDWAPRL